MPLLCRLLNANTISTFGVFLDLRAISPFALMIIICKYISTLCNIQNAKKQSSREIGKTVSKSEGWSLNTRKSFKNDLCTSCRGLALWPLSRFLAVAHRPPFPLIPWERLRLPLLWKSQRADSPLRDTQLWSAPAHRWVTCCEATGPDVFHSLCPHLRHRLAKLSICRNHESAVIWYYVRQSVPSVHKDMEQESEPAVIVFWLFKGAVHSESMNPG